VAQELLLRKLEHLLNTYKSKMNEGDIVIFDGDEYTIWLIEDGIYHIRNEEGKGYCGNLNWLTGIEE
jgi:signal peptidase I